MYEEKSTPTKHFSLILFFCIDANIVIAFGFYSDKMCQLLVNIKYVFPNITGSFIYEVKFTHFIRLNGYDLINFFIAEREYLKLFMLRLSNLSHAIYFKCKFSFHGGLTIKKKGGDHRHGLVILNKIFVSCAIAQIFFYIFDILMYIETLFCEYFLLLANI